MMLVIVALLATFALAEDDNASKYRLSSEMCGELSISNCSSTTLTTNKNKYCKSDKSFFTEDELGEFINILKSYNDGIDELNSYKDEFLDTLSKLEKVLKECGSECSESEKYVKYAKKLFEVYYDFYVDTSKLAYAMANSFNLGAMCLAADPTGNYDNDGKALIKNNIIDSLTSYCVDGIGMMKRYFIKIIDATNDVAGEKVIDKKEIEKSIDKLDKKTLCKEAMYYVKLDSELYGTIDGILSGIFESALEEFEDSLEIVEEIMSELSDLDLDDDEIVNEVKSKILKFNKLMKKNYITNDDDDDNGIIYSDKGFDVVKASENNPEYKEMVEESLPSSLKSGLAWWVILIIVLAVVIVVAVVVVLVVYFVVIKPKKEAKKEKKKDKNDEKDKSDSSESEKNRDSSD